MVPETPRNLNELITLAGELQEIFEKHGWHFCFIGGLAVQSWSEPRYTKDVDLTLLTGFGEEEHYIDVLFKHYEPRVAHAKHFAQINRVLLLKNNDGIGIDVAMGALDFEHSATQRAEPVEVYPGKFLRLRTAGDLIVMKAFAGRPQDWNDVRMTLVRQGVSRLDWDYILRHLEPLAGLKEDSAILTQLESLRSRYAGT